MRNIWNQWELISKAISLWGLSTLRNTNAHLSIVLGIPINMIQPCQELKDVMVLVAHSNNCKCPQLLTLHQLRKAPKSTRTHQAPAKLKTWAETRNSVSFKNWTMARAQANSCQIHHLPNSKRHLKREDLQLLPLEVAWWACNPKDQSCQLNQVNRRKVRRVQSHQRRWKTLFIKKTDLHTWK